MRVPRCLQQANQQKGNSVFYSNSADNSRALSPVPSVDLESPRSPDKCSPSSEVPESSEAPKATCEDEDRPSLDAEVEKDTKESQGDARSNRNDTEGESANEAIRPTNLALFENEGKPMRFKRVVKGLQQAKREARLLSVPNIKYQKSDGTVHDLRNEASSAGNETFAGNLFRRFSKCSLLA